MKISRKDERSHIVTSIGDLQAHKQTNNYLRGVKRKSDSLSVMLLFMSLGSNVAPSIDALSCGHINSLDGNETLAYSFFIFKHTRKGIFMKHVETVI